MLISSVASFLVLGGGGGGGKTPKCTDKKKNHDMWLKCTSERLTNIYIFMCQNTCYVYIHSLSMQFPYITYGMALYNNIGWPRNNGTVDTVKFSGLCSRQQLFSSPCWKEHLFPIIITPRSSSLGEKFLSYETFLLDCHHDLPDFQSFEARWQINGKSPKWQSINYS